ncbi:MAG: Gldg family protein, partial [Candidatus Eisenbacteria bacterium]
MSRTGRPLPLFLAGLLLLALGGAWSSIETGAWAYLPRFIVLAGALLLGWALIHHAGELRLLLHQARSFSEPGPTTTMLLLAGVLFLLALLGGRMSTPRDLTAERLNSLSRATQSVLDALPGTVRLEGYFADPSAAWDLARRYFDIYARSSRRLETRLVDPERDPAQARAAGVTRSNVVLVSYGTAVAEVQDVNEEAITQGILRVLEGEPRRIAFLQGHGEPSLMAGGDEGLSAWGEALRDANAVGREMILMDADSIGAATAALVVVHPQHPLYPSEVALIRRYVEGGGRLGIWVEPGDSTGLEPFLEQIYLRYRAGTIRDQGRVTGGIGLGPWVVAMVGDPNHPITAGLGTFAVLPSVRPIEVLSPHPMDLTAAPILKTTGPADVFADPQNPAAPLARGITAAGAFAQWSTPVGAAWTRRGDRRGLPP